MKEGRQTAYVVVTNGTKGASDRGIAPADWISLREAELDPRRTYTNFPGWHRDHRTTARVVLDCVYPLARDHLAFPDPLPDDEPHTVREVYTVQWEHPRLVIDITDTIDLKLQAIRCHASQIGDLMDFANRMRTRAADLGQERGYAYAEGFDHIVVPGSPRAA